jgi:hypothetical protein
MVARSYGATVTAAVVLAAALVAGALPAAAVTLPPTSTPLSGSSFQGGYGNQADEAPYTDWAGLNAIGRVGHVDDPNANDDVFRGGSKEDNPADWSFGTEAGGSTPGGTNIRDAWGSIDQSGGKTFLYLASARHSDTGTSFLIFELNRDSRLWNNGHTRIPCRREGDILITYQPHGNNETEVIVQRWHTLQTDSSSGCARTGTLVAATLQANVDAQGAFNSAAIANLLPGSMRSLAPRLFMETAIDLGKVAAEAFHDPCLAYTAVWMHSRSSISETSSLQDVVWPQPVDLRTCAAAGTKFVDLNANGQRDPGEPGIAGAKIFADYNNNGHPRQRRAVRDQRRGRQLRRRRHPPQPLHAARDVAQRDEPEACEMLVSAPRRYVSTRRHRRSEWVGLVRLDGQRRRGALRARPRLRQLPTGAAGRAQGRVPGGRQDPVRGRPPRPPGRALHARRRRRRRWRHRFDTGHLHRRRGGEPRLHLLGRLRAGASARRHVREHHAAVR